MKQLLILSGKGGTGKTTLAGAFIRRLSIEAAADCDVDAPNLHLVLGRTDEPETSDFYGLPKANVDADKCTSCGLCAAHCRFDAIDAGAGGTYTVDPYACEGCGVCTAICPEKAVTMLPAVAGELSLYDDGRSVFSTACLKMGSGTSGKLVTDVKKQLKTHAGDRPLAIIDGSPGIGCPVIASMNGSHLVLIVAEPSVAGFSDLERLVKTAATAQTRLAVCVNKYDTNIEITEQIEVFCHDRSIAFVGRVPYDPEAVRAVNSGRTIADVDCPAGRAVNKIIKRTIHLIQPDEAGDNKK